jgi:hypothetical protein
MHWAGRCISVEAGLCGSVAAQAARPTRQTIGATIRTSFRMVAPPGLARAISVPPGGSHQGRRGERCGGFDVVVTGRHLVSRRSVIVVDESVCHGHGASTVVTTKPTVVSRKPLRGHAMRLHVERKRLCRDDKRLPVERKRHRAHDVRLPLVGKRRSVRRVTLAVDSKRRLVTKKRLAVDRERLCRDDKRLLVERKRHRGHEVRLCVDSSPLSVERQTLSVDSMWLSVDSLRLRVVLDGKSGA